MTILAVGIDLAKNVLAVHGVNDADKAERVRPYVPRDKRASTRRAPAERTAQLTDCSASGHNALMSIPRRLVLVAVLAALASTLAAAQPAYFPPRSDWQRAEPAAVGLDAARLAEAVAYAQAHDNPAPRDQALALAQSFGRNEPYFGGQIGPTRERAAINGLVIRRGKVVAEWGDTQRVDMSHSITKTFLSTVVGLAWQQGPDQEHRRACGRCDAARRRPVHRAA